MKRVLMIDDEEELLVSIARYLEKKGVKVWTATRGEEGLELYKEHKPECVFLDIHLPTMDGMTVLKKLKEFDPDAKIYLATGDSRVDLQNKGESLGVAGYLVKPINIKEVASIVEGL